MKLAETIKEYLEKEDLAYKPYELFSLVAEDDASQYDAFYKALDILEKSGDIVYTKKGKIMSVKYSGFVKGTFRASAKGFGFVTPMNMVAKEHDIFIPRDHTLDAIEGDTVLASVTPPKYRKGDGQSDEGKIIKVISHNVKTITGTLLISRGRGKRNAPIFYIVPDNKKFIFDIQIDRSDLSDADVGDKVEVEITRYPSFKYCAKGKITTVFGASDSLTANYDAVLHYHNIKTLFPKNVLENADRLEKTEITPKDRLDLRDKVIFTIDGKDGKDLDDAISVEKTDSGYILGVHIADVSHYVTEDSDIDKEAMLRGTSVYFADKVVPMLPKSLSNGICSLNAGVDRYTLSAFMTLDKNGEIESTDIKESIINSKVRGVYTELNDYLENGKNSEYYEKYLPVSDTLDTMVELYKILDKKSTKRGAIDIETTEAKIIVNEYNEPTEIIKTERGITEMLIEQFMLCANEGVANWLFWQEMPCVYRIHENPDPEKIKTFDIFAYNLGLNTTPLHTKTIHPTSLRKIMSEARQKGLDSVLSRILLRSLMKARYSSAPSSHFGLAIEKYCHFTSPIRRYPDLATHRIIKKVLKGEIDHSNVGKYNAFATQAAINSSENEVKAQMAERDIEDLYKSVYMMQYVGEKFNGVITSVTSFGFFVELENTCEGLVPISSLDGYYDFNERSFTLSNGTNVFALGMEVEVIIEDVDIITRKTDMRLA